MNVLVTGTSRGLGRYLVKRFLADGHDVIGLSRGPVTFDSPRYRHLTADLNLVESLPEVVDQILALTPNLSVVVHNAVFFRRFAPNGERFLNERVALRDPTAEDYAEHYRINALAPYLLSRHIARRLTKSRGTMHAVMNSISTSFTETEILPYCASKAALTVLAKDFAREFKQSTHVMASLKLGSLKTEENVSEIEAALAATQCSREQVMRYLVKRKHPRATYEDFISLEAVYLTVVHLMNLGKAANGAEWAVSQVEA